MIGAPFVFMVGVNGDVRGEGEAASYNETMNTCSRIVTHFEVCDFTDSPR